MKGKVSFHCSMPRSLVYNNLTTACMRVEVLVPRATVHKSAL